MTDNQAVETAGWALEAASKARDLASASLVLQAAILKGLISSGVVNGDAVRSYLATLFSELTPDEREGAIGLAYSTALSALADDTKPSGTA